MGGGREFMGNEETKLYIPTNVKTRLEFFKGFGVKELVSTIIVAVCLIPISIIFARLYYIVFNFGYYLKNPMEILNIRSGGIAI